MEMRLGLNFTLFLSLFVLLGQPVMAQKLSFKLSYQGESYVGKMSPKWYNKVTLTPSEKGNLENAEGKMEGDRFPTMGFVITKNNLGTDEEWMVRTNNGWYPLSKVKIDGGDLSFKFDWAFRPEPRAIDLKVLKRADELLSSTDDWNPRDDRKCDDDFEKEEYSLYCLVQKAYLLETGEFNHRGAALNIVREYIGKLRPDRDYQHRLMDFNNTESFGEIKNVLYLGIRNFENSLSEK